MSQSKRTGWHNLRSTYNEGKRQTSQQAQHIAGITQSHELNKAYRSIVHKDTLFFGTVHRGIQYEPLIDSIRIANYYHETCHVTIIFHVPWLSMLLTNPIKIPPRYRCNIPVQLNQRVRRLANNAYRFDEAITIKRKYRDTQLEMVSIDVLFNLRGDTYGTDSTNHR